MEIADRERLLVALDAFAEWFHTQVKAAGAPGSEHAVHFCVALAFQAVLNLPPGSIVFERPADRGRQRIDLWVGPEPGTWIEVKYNRPIPSGKNRPFTQLYGSLLADFNKLAQTTAANRLVILVADQPSSSHLQRSGRGVLPSAVGQQTVMSAGTIAGLAVTARNAAGSHGDWATEVGVEMIWNHLTEGWALTCWALEPLT